MKKIFLILALISTASFAGGTGGGSTPPGKELLSLLSKNQQAMTISSDTDPILLTNKDLNSTITLTASETDLDALRISREDQSFLSTLKQIEVVNPEQNLTRSYLIKDGDKLNSILLIDQREYARASVLPKQ